MIGLLFACVDNPGASADPEDAEPVDTQEPGDSGADSAGDTLDCEGTMRRTIELVVQVEWPAPSGATSYVEYGESEGYGQRTPSTTASAVSLELLGNGPDRDVHWRGVSEVGGEVFTCVGVTHTGVVPDNLPVVEVVVNDAAAQSAAPFVIGAFYSSSSSQAQLAAYRRDGTVVWYWAGADGGSSLDVHADPAGRGFYYNVFPEGRLGAAEASLFLVSPGGDPLASWATPYAHHTFAARTDGSVLLQRTDSREYVNPRTRLTELWVGDRLTAMDSEGGLADVFSTWDVLPPRENVQMDVLQLYDGRDWTHGNLIRVDAASDTLTLSLAHAQDVLTLDGTTYRVREVVGVDGLAATPEFSHNHDPTWLDADHLLMFSTEGAAAGAIEYARTDAGMVEVWRGEFGPAPFALGQAARLPNGNTFVSYGTRNRMVELTPDGEVVWQMELASTLGGAYFGQFHLVDDLYSAF